MIRYPGLRRRRHLVRPPILEHNVSQPQESQYPLCTDPLSIRTEAELRQYLAEFFVKNATSSELDRLLQLYPADVTQGSPFDTGTQNVITPQFKRIAAFLGDFVFQGPRRLLLQQRSGKQDTWSFCACRPCVRAVMRLTFSAVSKRLKASPVLGAVRVTSAFPFTFS